MAIDGRLTTVLEKIRDGLTELIELVGEQPSVGGISNPRVPMPRSRPQSFKANRFIVAYCEAFKSRWGLSPQIQGKDAGIAKRLAKTISDERFDHLLSAFFKMPDSQLVKWKHPFSAFEMKLNEITVFADSGEFHTQRQAQQADDSVALSDQLKRIDKGSL